MHDDQRFAQFVGDKLRDLDVYTRDFGTVVVLERRKVHVGCHNEFVVRTRRRSLYFRRAESEQLVARGVEIFVHNAVDLILFVRKYRIDGIFERAVVLFEDESVLLV